MYEAFYGLRERPFNLTPDPKYLYLSDKHKEAFAHLLYGIKNRSGFVMISGEIGTGKTTLCRNMLSQMDANTEVAFIFNPFLNPVELLRKINQEFGIVSNADNILELTEELNKHLLSAAAHGKNSVLVIDEAQNLEPQVLEQIRLLSNLETDSEKLLQIILIGQPELAEKLALHELRQLNQRITARYHLKPLNALETLQYIAYRIHVAGGRKKLNFTKGAIKAVYRKSGGVPRMINALCDRALLIGYTKEQHVITAAIVRQAAREIKGEKLAAKRPKSRISIRSLLPSPTLVVVVVLVLALAHFLMDPLDRFARELNVFNKILSGDFESISASSTTENADTATADVQQNTAGAVSAKNSTEDLGALKLVMERLNSSTAIRSSDSLAAIFMELDPTATLHAGVDALVSLWNHNLAGDYPASDSVEMLSLYFERHGLACEYLKPSTAQLSRINIPGMVRLVAGGNRLWMTILRMDNERVTLQGPDNRRVTVSREEFNIYYGQEFLAPWRDPAPDAPVLLLGETGARVQDLKAQLHALGRLETADLNDVYDARTEKAVIALQNEAGLTTDGKAGPQVRLALTSLSGNTPALRRGNTHSASNDSVRDHTNAEPKNPSLSQSALAADHPATKTSTHAREAVVADKENQKEKEPFETVSENTATVKLPGPETPVMTLPEDYTAETIKFTPSHEKENTHSLPGNNTAERELGIMEVRELPEPFAEPVQREKHFVDNAVTEPVYSSSPLVPHREM